MDTKVTLSFNKEIIEKAKTYAADQNISLSRLIEFLLRKVTTKSYQALDDFPISEWVHQVADGQAVYNTRKSRKKAKDEFFESKK